MKIIIIPIISLLLLSCGQSENTEKKESTTSSTEKDDLNNNSGHLFDIKSAKIVYKIANGPQSGTQTLYIDDYGAKAVLVLDLKSKYDVNNQTLYWNGKQTIMINHETKAVSKSPFRPKATEPPALANTGEQIRKSIGYEKLGDETIAGKTCEVWFNAKQNFKYYLWNKFALKMVLGNSINEEAIAVEDLNELPASLIEIPTDYKQ